MIRFAAIALIAFHCWHHCGGKLFFIPRTWKLKFVIYKFCPVFSNGWASLESPRSRDLERSRRSSIINSWFIRFVVRTETWERCIDWCIRHPGIYNTLDIDIRHNDIICIYYRYTTLLNTCQPPATYCAGWLKPACHCHYCTTATCHWSKRYGTHQIYVIQITYFILARILKSTSRSRKIATYL